MSYHKNFGYDSVSCHIKIYIVGMIFQSLEYIKTFLTIQITIIILKKYLQNKKLKNAVATYNDYPQPQ